MIRLLTLLIVLLLHGGQLIAQSNGNYFNNVFDYNREWEVFGEIEIYGDGQYYITGESKIAGSTIIGFKINKHGQTIDSIRLLQKSGVHYYGGRFNSLTNHLDYFYMVGVQDSTGLYKGYWLQIDTSGNVLQHKLYDTDSSGKTQLNSISALHDGGFIIAGERNNNAYLLRIDSLGSVLWDKEYGGSDRDAAAFVFPAENGGFVASGYTYSYTHAQFYCSFYYLKTDSAGKMLWQKSFGFKRRSYCTVMPFNNGNYFLTGAYQYAPTQTYWGYIAELTPNGDTLWQKHYTHYPFIYPVKTIELSDESLIILSLLDYGKASSLMKTDNRGNIIWERVYQHNPNASNYLYDIEQTADKGFVMVGFSRDTLPDGANRDDQDGWVLKVDSLGYASYDDYVGIDDNFYYRKNLVKAYPNPAQSFVNFFYNLPEKHGDGKLAVYNMQGQQVWQRQVSGTGTVTADLSAQPAGVYVYRLNINGVVSETGKIVLQK